MKIRIKNLRLRCIIGFQDWERKKKQDVIINIMLETKAPKMDDKADCVDYKKITKKVIAEVEMSEFNLLENLTKHIKGIVMGFDGVMDATVEVDKPGALRFADSVSVEE